MQNIFLEELGRKIFHMAILLVLAFYFMIENQFGKTSALLALMALLVFFLILEYLRLEIGWRMPLFSQLIREKEREKFCGIIYFLSATIICLAVFDFGIALAALLMATFGDMVAALIGRSYGVTILFRNKTVTGSASELLANIIIALVIAFVGLSHIYVLVAMAFVATLSEIAVSELDDNLIVPLFSGFVGQLMSSLF